MTTDLRLSKRAQKDWRRLSQSDQARLLKAFGDLRAAVPRRALDDKPLAGAEPWRRLRVGDHRVIFRPLTTSEQRALDVQQGFLVERVIDRRDLEKAIKNLR